VCALVHLSTGKETEAKLGKEQRHEHVPMLVEASYEVKVILLWNQQFQTDRTILSNKPDIIIRDNKKGTCTLLDVAVSADRNVIKKETGKILKYKDLTTKIQSMWNVKQR
jgi:hypothetical protein